MRRKNAKEMFGGFFKNMVKSADEVLISGIKVKFLHDIMYILFYIYISIYRCIYIQYRERNDHVVTSSNILCVFSFLKQEVDDFFEQEKTFLLDYYSKIKDSTTKAEKMTHSHKSIGGVLLYSTMRLGFLYNIKYTF